MFSVETASFLLGYNRNNGVVAVFVVEAEAEGAARSPQPGPARSTLQTLTHRILIMTEGGRNQYYPHCMETEKQEIK